MKKILVFFLIMVCFVTFMPKAYAADCQTGTCYCDKDNKDRCALNNYAKAPYVVESPKSKCGCDTSNSFCDKTAEIWQFVGYGLFAIKIIIPLIIMIFGMIDFSKAVMSGDDKTIKGAGASLIKRLVLCICIFFVPTIISLIFKMVDSSSIYVEGAKRCEECLTDPTGYLCKTYVKEAQEARKNGAN